MIISTIFWLINNFKKKNHKKFFNFEKKNAPFLILILLVYFQIIFGAFVSGLDAGRLYQTWPLMGYTFFPDDVVLENFRNIIDFNNHSLVQFYHRIL